MTEESSDLIDLERPEVIDLSEPEPSLVDVVCSAAVARAATRALRDLEHHSGHAPWIVVCTANSNLIATSPSFDEDLHADWKVRVDEVALWEQEGIPLAVVALGSPISVDDDDPASVHAQLVAQALSGIVVAERRAAVATARAGRAEALASTDALTGLGNQRAWWDRVAEEEAHRARSSRPCVVIVIDLDDLKAVNDERGHLHGDLLLRVAAQTLRRTLRGFDVIARVGGDEFAVLALDYEGDATLLGERLGQALEAADIHASIGVAVPSATMSLTDAYAAADRAMYANKRRRHQHSNR